MKKKILSSIVLLCFVFTFSQSNSYKIHTIAFYNLENLFDVYNDTLKKDEISPIMEITSNRELIYHKKLSNISKVISEIGKKTSKIAPTIIGVSEIENKKVLEDLIQTPLLKKENYGIIHHDSPDLRGIDVGFLFKKNHFTPLHFQAYELKLWSDKGNRIYTRDQLLVSGYLENEMVHFIINHWPSRRGGEKRSRRLREKAALLTKKICDSLFSSNEKAKIIVMGDFNDDPIDSSFKNFLHTNHDSKTTDSTDLFNPYENLFLKGFNTLGYRDNLNLFDQILISKNLISKSKKFETLAFFKAKIFNPKYLTQQKGRYKNYPFRSFQNGKFTNGYSDHYPVNIFLIKQFN